MPPIHHLMRSVEYSSFNLLNVVLLTGLGKKVEGEMETPACEGV